VPVEGFGVCSMEVRCSLTFFYLAEGVLGLGGLLLCRQVKKRIVGSIFGSRGFLRNQFQPFFPFRSLMGSSTIDNSDVRSKNLNQGASPGLIDLLAALVQLHCSDSVFILVHEDQPECCVAKRARR
jgi:hypothetical protein